MKFFVLSQANVKYSYSNWTYVGSFGIQPDMVKETDYNRLIKLSQTALGEGNDESALLYAGKAAIEYGIAGLLFYIDIYTEILSKDRDRKEIIEQDAMRLLAYLSFAQRMLSNNELKALRSIDMVGMEDTICVDFWANRVATILSFIKPDHRQFVETEAAAMAEELVSMTSEDGDTDLSLSH